VGQGRKAWRAFVGLVGQGREAWWASMGLQLFCDTVPFWQGLAPSSRHFGGRIWTKFLGRYLTRAFEKSDSDGCVTGRINSRAVRPAPRRRPARLGTGSREVGGQKGIWAKDHADEDLGREAVDVMRFV
jgi:hypothetical protein